MKPTQRTAFPIPPTTPRSKLTASCGLLSPECDIAAAQCDRDFAKCHHAGASTASSRPGSSASSRSRTPTASPPHRLAALEADERHQPRRPVRRSRVHVVQRSELGRAAEGFVGTHSRRLGALSAPYRQAESPHAIVACCTNVFRKAKSIDAVETIWVQDRPQRGDMIDVRAGRGAVGSPEVAPVEGGHRCANAR